MSDPDAIFSSYSPMSPLPADQLLRRNVVDYLERERPFDIVERPEQNSRASGHRDIEYDNNSNRKRKNDVLHSYIKKPLKGIPAKIIRLQIFEPEEFNNADNSICHCKATVCAQYVTDLYSDDIYKCAKELVSKIHRKFSC